jgi:hypothetical protein
LILQVLPVSARKLLGAVSNCYVPGHRSTKFFEIVSQFCRWYMLGFDIVA